MNLSKTHTQKSLLKINLSQLVYHLLTLTSDDPKLNLFNIQQYLKYFLISKLKFLDGLVMKNIQLDIEDADLDLAIDDIRSKVW